MSGTLTMGQTVFYAGPEKDYGTATLKDGDQGTLVRVEAKTDAQGQPYNAFVVSMAEGFEASEPAKCWKDKADYQAGGKWKPVLWVVGGLAAVWIVSKYYNFYGELDRRVKERKR